MKESIGEIIRESVKKSGLTQEEFAKEMGMTLRNLANLFNKTRLPIEQLVRASRILKEDFVLKYTQILYDEEPGLSQFKPEERLLGDDQPVYEPPVHKQQTVSFTINIKGQFNKVAEELPGLLQAIKNETEARGLQMG